MENYRTSAHRTYDIKYHIAWIAKYRKLQIEYKALNKQFRDRHLWARGYFVASSGDITDEAISEYINNQDIAENMNSDNFGMSELLAVLAASTNPPASSRWWFS